MGKTKIEWADYTWNPWVGCQKVGPGCDNCYAESWAKRSGLVQWGPDAIRRKTSNPNWRAPHAWNKRAEAEGRPATVFCGSLMDWADNKAPLGARGAMWEVIRQTPNLIWMLLTKRPGNIRGCLPSDWDRGYPNVALMITVVNQQEADRDIPGFLKIAARWRGLSVEPMLGPVNLWSDANYPLPGGGTGSAFDWGRGVHFVITGGESGPKRRPSDPEWFRSIRDQCAAAGAAYFHKQMTGKGPIPDDLRIRQLPDWRRDE